MSSTSYANLFVCNFICKIFFYFIFYIRIII